MFMRDALQLLRAKGECSNNKASTAAVIEKETITRRSTLSAAFHHQHTQPLPGQL